MRFDHFPPNVASGGGGGIAGIDVQDEGVTVVNPAAAIDFVGAGVTVTDVGGVPTVTIPGGGGGPMFARATWVNGGLPLVAADANIVYVYCPVAGTVTSASLLTIGGPGSCVVDIRTGAYGSFPTAGSICGAAKPTISSGLSALDTTLTGWTTSVAAGDFIAFVLQSTSVFTAIFAQLEIQP